MIHRFQELISTQDRAHQLAADGAPHGTVVVAETQSAGRGTRGRAWSSEPGGLWLTVITRPSSTPAIACLSLRVGMAVARLLSQRVSDAGAVQLKWPNDLVARDRKLGGILCEARWLGHRLGWVAVGVGLNVTNPIPPSLMAGAIRLSELGFADHAGTLVEAVGAAVLEAARGAGPLTRAELEEFAERDWLKGKTISSPEEGVVRGVSADGRLLVEKPDGGRTTVLGSVTLSGLAHDTRGG